MCFRVISVRLSSLVSLVARGLPSRALVREEGQTLAEYALILGLVALAVIGAVLFLQGSIGDLFSKMGSSL